MNSEKLKIQLENLYGSDVSTIEYQVQRYESLIEKCKTKFNKENCWIFSTPGRTELGGNHTDHNNGIVLAAGINIDSVAVVSKANNNEVILYSEGYDEPFVVNLDNLLKVIEEEGRTESLIRGVAFRFNQLGFNVGGFNAVITSDVLPGSGLSSSASIEVLIGSIFNTLFNNGKVSKNELAKIGQFAENNYFGKPCGLMDQMACAVGGIITIDFEENENPVVQKVAFNFKEINYTLIVVSTGGNHVDLTDDYASIPLEMKSVANFFGKSNCREISYNEIIESIDELRSRLGDRAILRVLHFIKENERVFKQVTALNKKEYQKFFDLVKDSGNSSFKWLQNIYTSKNVNEQGITLALAITEEYLNNIKAGACRVHGGGFAGTIQVFLPDKYVEKYIDLIEQIFGKGSAIKLSIRSEGTVLVGNI